MRTGRPTTPQLAALITGLFFSLVACGSPTEEPPTDPDPNGQEEAGTLVLEGSVVPGGGLQISESYTLHGGVLLSPSAAPPGAMTSTNYTLEGTATIVAAPEAPE